MNRESCAIAISGLFTQSVKVHIKMDILIAAIAVPSTPTLITQSGVQHKFQHFLPTNAVQDV